MANLAAKLTPVVGKGFDIERGLLYPPGVYIVLLARDGRESAFRELKRFLLGFKLTYDSFRIRTRLEIATLADLQEIVPELSHFWFMGRVYAVGDGDVTPPFGDRFTWLLLGTVSVRDKYEPPEEDPNA